MSSARPTLQRILACLGTGVFVYVSLWAIMHSLIELGLFVSPLHTHGFTILVTVAVVAASARLNYVTLQEFKRELRMRQRVRLLYSLRELQEECACIVEKAVNYIISVGGESRCSYLFTNIERVMEQRPGLRHIRLLPAHGISASVHNYLARLLTRLPNLAPGWGTTLTVAIRAGRPLDFLVCANERRVVLVLDGGQLLTGEPLAVVISDSFVVCAVYRWVLDQCDAGLVVHSEAELPPVR